MTAGPTTAADCGLWIRRFHRSPDCRVRLLCLPHAGGSASFFLPVARALAPEVEVLAVQYPGRQDRRGEECVDNVPELAGRLLDALAGWLDRPLALFGHSMGALVGFELAGLMEREAHVSPVVLFASGRRAPSLADDEGVHLRSDEQIIAEMQRLGGTDARILGDPEMRALILPALRADLKAAECYRAARTQRIGCPIEVLMGDADPRTPLPETRAWREHTSSDFDLTVYPGGHFFLAERAPEVIRQVAERLVGQPLNR